MKEELTTSQGVSKTRSYGVARCHNADCSARIAIPTGVKTCKCPQCGCEWRVVWVSPQVCRIRGPVWETNRKLAEEAFEKKK